MDINELRKCIKGSISFNKQTCAHHSVDKSFLTPEAPTMVITPHCSMDISYVLRFANEHRYRITPQGACSGKSGGAIPEKEEADKKSIALSFLKLNHIIELDLENACVVVEPGVVLDDIRRLASKHGLFYPVDPSSSDWCTIGGNVAENAGGASAIKYGVTADYVMAVSGYFPNGETFKLGRKCYKDVAGYNLKQLMVGSEGTLGVITEITLKLIPKPRYESSFWCTFKSMTDACTFLQHMCRSSFHFSAAEFIEEACLKAVSSYLDMAPIWLKDNVVLLRYDTDTQEGLACVETYVKNYCDTHHAECFTGESSEYWKVRRSVSEALKACYTHKMSEDVTIPRASIGVYLHYIKKYCSEDIFIVGYGHLGDGNVHTNILNKRLSEREWNVQKEMIIKDIMHYAVTLGGTLTGEHGVGLTKKSFMPLYFSKFEIDLMKTIKRRVDPNNICNPSKVFSDEALV